MWGQLRFNKISTNPPFVSPRDDFVQMSHQANGFLVRFCNAIIVKYIADFNRVRKRFIQMKKGHIICHYNWQTACHCLNTRQTPPSPRVGSTKLETDIYNANIFLRLKFSRIHVTFGSSSNRLLKFSLAKSLK